jgi:hypothetical protein
MASDTTAGCEALAAASAGERQPSWHRPTVLLVNVMNEGFPGGGSVEKGVGPPSRTT